VVRPQESVAERVWQATGDDRRRPDRRGERRRACCPRFRGGFTVTELLVVVAVIILILGLGVPAFNNMTRDARFSQSISRLNGMLARAALTAQADNTSMLVRFAPAEWEMDPNYQKAGESDDARRRLSGRMRASLYRYRAWLEDPSQADQAAEDPNQFLYSEVFRRSDDAEEVILPPDVWAAQVDGLSDLSRLDSRNHVLNGRFSPEAPINRAFVDNWYTPNNEFLDADDFTIVFDPGRGLRRGSVTGVSMNSNAYAQQAASVDVMVSNPDPADSGTRRERSVKRRYFTGAVFYQRRAFEAYGNDTTRPTTQARLDYLLRTGQPYHMESGGGGLVRGIGPGERAE